MENTKKLKYELMSSFALFILNNMPKLESLSTKSSPVTGYSRCRHELMDMIESSIPIEEILSSVISEKLITDIANKILHVLPKLKSTNDFPLENGLFNFLIIKGVLEEFLLSDEQLKSKRISQENELFRNGLNKSLELIKGQIL